MTPEELEEHVLLKHEADQTLIMNIKEYGQVTLELMHNSLHGHGFGDHTHSSEENE